MAVLPPWAFRNVRDGQMHTDWRCNLSYALDDSVVKCSVNPRSLCITTDFLTENTNNILRNTYLLIYLFLFRWAHIYWLLCKVVLKCNSIDMTLEILKTPGSMKEVILFSITLQISPMYFKWTQYYLPLKFTSHNFSHQKCLLKHFYTVRLMSCYTSSSLMHLIFTVCLDCIKALCQTIDPSHLDLFKYALWCSHINESA